MKVTMERAALLRVLGHVHRVVERRNTIPILSNVLLKAGDGQVTIKGTDLDMEITESFAAEIERKGGTTLPAHMIYDIVRKFPDGAQVQMESKDENQVVVKSGRSRFALQSLPEADFPDLLPGELKHSFSMRADALSRLIDRTGFAISSDETRYYLNGIHVHATSDGKMRTVATDGHRLAMCEVDCPEGAAGMDPVILPRKVVDQVRKLVDEDDEMVRVEISPTKARFTLAGAVIVTKLIDGTFPDYERVIPRANPHALSVDRATFREAIDRVSTIAPDKSRAVKFSIDAGKLVMTTANTDAGSGHEEMEVEYSAPAIQIGFNPRYVMDVIAQLETPEAEFMLGQPDAPALVRDKGASDAVFVLMPMRT